MQILEYHLQFITNNREYIMRFEYHHLHMNLITRSSYIKKKKKLIFRIEENEGKVKISDRNVDVLSIAFTLRRSLSGRFLSTGSQRVQAPTLTTI